MPTVQANFIPAFPALRLGQGAQPSAPRAGSNHTSFRATGTTSPTSPGGSGSFAARPFSLILPERNFRGGFLPSTCQESRLRHSFGAHWPGLRLPQVPRDNQGGQRSGASFWTRCPQGDFPGGGCAGPTASRAEGIPPPCPASSPTTGPRQHGRVGFFWR